MSKEVETYLKGLEKPAEEIVKEAKPAVETDTRAKEDEKPWTHYASKPIKYQNGCVYGNWRKSITAACLGGLPSYIEEIAIIEIHDYPKTCSNGNKLVVCVHN